MRISIDPGGSGGIACKIDGKIYAFKMPDTPKDIWGLILSLKSDDTFCWVERVGGYMPGNSGPAAVAFARHCGHIDMALLAAGIRHDTVTSQKWMHWLIGKPNYPKLPEIPKELSKKDQNKMLKEQNKIRAKRKQERKNKIKEKMQRLYPDLKVTLALADALGLLYYGINNEIMNMMRKNNFGNHGIFKSKP